MSIRPRARQRAITWLTCSRSVTSSGSTIRRSPYVFESSLRVFGRRTVATTASPSAKASATKCRPSPPDAPVMNQCRDISISSEQRVSRYSRSASQGYTRHFFHPKCLERDLSCESSLRGFEQELVPDHRPSSTHEGGVSGYVPPATGNQASWIRALS